VYNIKMDLREIAWNGMECIDLAQDGDQWRTLVNTVMNHLFHIMLVNPWVTAQLAASQEGLSSTELAS
jgi:hypothetical protein